MPLTVSLPSQRKILGVQQQPFNWWKTQIDSCYVAFACLLMRWCSIAGRPGLCFTYSWLVLCWDCLLQFVSMRTLTPENRRMCSSTPFQQQFYSMESFVWWTYVSFMLTCAMQYAMVQHLQWILSNFSNFLNAYPQTKMSTNIASICTAYWNWFCWRRRWGW